MRKTGRKRNEEKKKILHPYIPVPGCGNKVFATKLKSPTGDGHIKTMYCPWCKADKDMEQVGITECK